MPRFSLRSMSPRVAEFVPCALLVALLTAGHAAMADTSSKPDCFEQLERGRDSEIICAFPTRLTDEEKTDLKRLTRELLQDARCVVSIRIERSQIDAALAAGDYVFTSPPQPVRCEIVMRERTLEITGAFSPRVVFVGGLATEATPGLGDVKGVSQVLAWPVVHYVNNAGSIRSGMLTVINGYRAHRTQRNASSH